jgi:uncharacterized protein YndB with AHSA1/START domain
MRRPLVEVDTLIDADPATVWHVMTRESSAMFMGARVRSDWKAGSPITFKGELTGKTFEDHGEIRAIEQERQLAFTHFSPRSGKPDRPENYNFVRFVLEPEGDRTRVTLTQTPEGDGPAPNDETRAEFEKNWRLMLDGLKKAAEERVSERA